jgi:hypothetical protein
MPFSMKLWQVRGQDLQEIKREALNDEQRLENWVVKDPSILGIDVLLIGRQVIEQKKRADDQAKAAARLRRFIWAMVVVSLLAVVAAVFAWTRQREAAQQARIALSRELAAAATHSPDAELQVRVEQLRCTRLALVRS